MGSSHMMLRDLYLPADTDLNLPAATATATELCRQASLNDLGTLLDNQWITADEDDDWTDEQIAEHADALRQRAEQQLHRVLADIAASLNHRDVQRRRLDPAEPGQGGGVDAYLTGGLTSSDECPTDSYGAWDLLFDTDKLPPQWSDRLGAAAGLMHPVGDGPVAAVVALYLWSPNQAPTSSPSQDPDPDTTAPGPRAVPTTKPAADPPVAPSRPPTVQERILAAATDAGYRAGCQVSVQPQYANTGSVYFTPGQRFTPRVTLRYRFNDDYCSLDFTGPGIAALGLQQFRRPSGIEHPVPGRAGWELVFHHLPYVDGERIERMLTLLAQALDDPGAPQNR